ncbi:MAG: TauD/TfdA family dioxygenase [Myxococcales bacterium]|nr:TauD/TfdA family dioxygenase [Myxococcales bacterium]
MLHYGPRPFLHEMREELEQAPYKRITLRPLSPTIGAEIGGVDLGDLDDETFAEIERAHLDYKVIFFRDQDITTEQHLAFARRFGELEEHPFLPSKEGYEKIIRFAKDEDVKGVENVWHSDVSWREQPSLGSVLRAHEVPSVGGDTLFSDMVAAYQGLDDELKAKLEGLRAVHDFTHTFGLVLGPEALAEKQKEFPAVEHPVVRTHPVTGKKAIYVNAVFTSHIVGMEREEGDRLLRFLYREAAVPEYQCRFRWQKNSIAFWDNRSVQHYAASDYWPQQRVMERVTVIGDRPA